MLCVTISSQPRRYSRLRKQILSWLWRISRENVKTFRWKWPHRRHNFHYHSLRSFSVCRTPRRIAGVDRGKSLLNNRAETLQLPRGNIGMITPCVQRCINELHATRVCLSNTKLLIQISDVFLIQFLNSLYPLYVLQSGNVEWFIRSILQCHNKFKTLIFKKLNARKIIFNYY